ncbi:MAG: methyltransferase [Chloroflexi bacterium]|nr:methyltransferase [Chloroflexota bacterium]
MLTTTATTPEVIDNLTSGVYPAFAMLAGMQLDLFTPLGDGPMSADQLADAIGVGSAKLKPLLYSLVTANLLTVDGEVFSNTPEADHFLVQGRPNYIGQRHGIMAQRWATILKTGESVRAGTAQGKIDFPTISRDAVESSSRIHHQATLAAGRDLVARYDLSRCHQLLEIGGRTGGLTFAVLDAHPQMRGTVVDLPATTPITQQYVEEAGLAGRVRVVAADVVEDRLEGSFDVAVMKSLIQVLNRDQVRRALRNVGQVIVPGGAIYILGSVLDDSRLSPPEAVASSLNFLNIYDGGQAYTEGEYRDWLTEAGFVGFERVVVPDGTSIITARKPNRANMIQ